MKIKVTQSLIGRFNQAVFAGMEADFPDGFAMEIIEAGYAIEIPEKITPENTLQIETPENKIEIVNTERRGRKKNGSV